MGADEVVQWFNKQVSVAFKPRLLSAPWHNTVVQRASSSCSVFGGTARRYSSLRTIGYCVGTWSGKQEQLLRKIFRGICRRFKKKRKEKKRKTKLAPVVGYTVDRDP